MANMEERLEAVVVQAESDGEKWHTIVHGDENTNVLWKAAMFRPLPNNSKTSARP